MVTAVSRGDTRVPFPRDAPTVLGPLSQNGLGQ